MNIGLSTSVIQRGKSGIARYVLALIENLMPQADAHRFVLFVLEEDLPLFAFASSQMMVVPISEKFRQPMRDIVWHQTVLPKLAYKHGLDVLHIPSYRRMPHRTPCARVATIHDLAPFRLRGKYDRFRTFYGRVVVRVLAHRQQRIIAVSQSTADDLMRFYKLPERRITVIPNGIDHGRFSPGDPRAAREWVAQKSGIQQPFFLYVARLEHPAKNHVRLIEAFNQFKSNTGSPWKLVLGGGDWHGAEQIHRAMQESPFRKDIHSLGFIEDAVLPTWYRAAVGFVFPSLFEGFGLPPVEAMACGCPVLSSTRGALEEAVGTAAGTIDPEDTDDLQRKLTRLATDANWREALREAGIQQARKFSWERVAASTMEVYKQAIVVPSPGGFPARGNLGVHP